MKRYTCMLFLLMLVGFCGCSPQKQHPAQTEQGNMEQEIPVWEEMKTDHSMELQFANQFHVDYYEGGYALISIENSGSFLVIPKHLPVPERIPEDMVVLQRPVNHVYLVSTSAMDLFRAMDGLDAVTLTGTKACDWYIDEAKQAMEAGDIEYAGKYNAPDYELILSKNCQLAVENTMILHNPEVKEQLEQLGIPVLVERSSYESHPLGRMEWIKLYGVLLGKEEQAEAFFDSQVAQLDHIMSANVSSKTPDDLAEEGNEIVGSSETTEKGETDGSNRMDNDDADEKDIGKTVAFFYITSNGAVSVRKSGDYVSKMIALAGGEYVLKNLEEEEENALSTMNIQMEAFYAGAKDADYLIYNSTIDGEMDNLDELLKRSRLLGDFKAVRNGNVWCTKKSMFQESTGIANMIVDLHRILTEEEPDGLTYFYPLE